ncbi:hypothetical protein [Streptomyces sp. MJP52]|uniref:hypothetical protein n=1 Tax=Streptomyces sp. MJP52 TaxID=2940555 RepID=UPI0024760D1B|nr:hypothetical protein [Streptomyces sp. MJP52]MDH6223281.1 hypothetical protein [Streptomyces sp. MJP52]
MFTDSPFDVLGLEISATDTEIRSAYTQAAKEAGGDKALRDRVSRAYNALRRPPARLQAAILTPLPGRLPPEAGDLLPAEAAQRMAEVPPLLPDPANLGVPHG